MIGHDGHEEDDELFLDVDTDSDDCILKPEVPLSFNAKGEGLIQTPSPLNLIFT
jgi:hypothetical protein